jgi:hypothetical protein
MAQYLVKHRDFTLRTCKVEGALREEFECNCQVIYQHLQLHRRRRHEDVLGE